MTKNEFGECEAVARARLRRLVTTGEARAIRVRAGVPQQALASSIRASRSTVESWESGRRRPRSPLAERYLGVLDALAAVGGDQAGAA